jgi:hypothetical protein
MVASSSSSDLGFSHSPPLYPPQILVTSYSTDFLRISLVHISRYRHVLETGFQDVQFVSPIYFTRGPGRVESLNTHLLDRVCGHTQFPIPRTRRWNLSSSSRDFVTGPVWWCVLNITHLWLVMLFIVTTSPNRDWVIWTPADFLGCGSRLSGSLSGIEP